MTQEQKAKAYDEAIKRGLDYIKHTPATEMVTRQDIFEAIFPEFKESEDEKIRKTLIEYFNAYPKDYYCELNKNHILAWLEKQKPIDEEEVLKGARMDVALSIINYLDNNSVGMCLSNMECEDIEDACVNSKWAKLYNYMKKKLEKQGEQNTVNTVEPRFKINDKVIHKETGKIWTIHWYVADTNSYYVIDEEKIIHHYTEDVLESAEQNPAELPQGFYYVDKDGNKLYSGNGYIKLKVNDWSEEDENILKAITYTVKNSGYKQCIGVSNEIMVNWLKSLKERVQPQSKQEWSEEDEWKFSDILALLRGGENCHYNTPDLFDFLKSLKDKHTWKPSDAQMGSLANVCDGKIAILDYLNSLYQDLKKLKE